MKVCYESPGQSTPSVVAELSGVWGQDAENMGR
jgi:hypothetical protein